MRSSVTLSGAPVPGLLALCCPSAVLRAVRAVVVDAVNRVQRRGAHPHVGVESLEVIPRGADRDTAPAVVGIGVMLPIQASRAHPQPTVVLSNARSALCAPMPLSGNGQNLLFPAATRDGHPASEVPSNHGTGFTAGTAAHPSDPTFWRPLCVLGDHGQAAELSAGRHGNLWRHQAHSWCQTPAVGAVRGHFASLNYTRYQMRLLLKEQRAADDTQHVDMVTP